MLSIGRDSFVTLEEANSIINELYLDDEEEKVIWSKLSDSNKEVLLRRGTIALNKFNYIGHRDVNSNPLKFPRYINGVNVIPYDIKKATVIQSLYSQVVKGSEYHRLRKNGVSSMTVGPSSISFSNDSSSNDNCVCDEAYSLIYRYVVNSIDIIY